MSDREAPVEAPANTRQTEPGITSPGSLMTLKRCFSEHHQWPPKRHSSVADAMYGLLVPVMKRFAFAW